jgi:hypothetical protein
MTREEIADLIQTIASKYDDHDDPVITRRDQPLQPPTTEEWRALEAKFECKLPLSFKNFIEVMSTYDQPEQLFVAARNEEPFSSETIALIYDRLVEFDEWPEDLIPFNGVHGDYYCLSATAGEASPVIFVSDDVVREECAEQIAASFDDWLANIEEHLGGELAGIFPEDVERAPIDRETRDRLRAALSVSSQWFPNLFKK